VFDLDALLNHPRGVQALAGLTGFGLPPVDVQWIEGAGNGARFRSKRHLKRTIDLPLLVDGNDRAGLKDLMDRLGTMLLGECTLRWIEDDGTSWTTQVHRTGGGDYVYGDDTTGERDLFTVVSLTAGDPFWTSSEAQDKVVSNAGIGNGLLPNLVQMKLAASQAIGEVELENPGNVPAYPVWEITGPGENFLAIAPTGETFAWNGTLLAGEKLFVDTRTGRVYDDTGANRYAEVGPAPRFWTIPPGRSTAVASLEGAESGSFQVVSTRTNYVLNPSVETNLTGYTTHGDVGMDPTLVRSNSDAWVGSYSIKATSQIGGNPWIFYSVPGLTVGQSYTARVAVWAEYVPGAGPVWLKIGGTGLYVGAMGVTNQWVELAVNFTATTTTQVIELHCSTHPSDTVDTWWDGLYVGDGGAYFDGVAAGPDDPDTIAWRWAGTPHASKSFEDRLEYFESSSIKCSWHPRKALVV
jgi:hypothetical protein